MSEPEAVYWSQPNQQVVRDGEPVGIVDDNPDPQTEGFDPGEHTVDEVLQYLEDNPDEVDTVLDLESEGKARKGVLAWGDD